MIPLSVCSQEIAELEVEIDSDKNRWSLAADILTNSYYATANDLPIMWRNLMNDSRSIWYSGAVIALVATDREGTAFYQNEIETRINYSLPDIAIDALASPVTSGNDTYLVYSTLGIYFSSMFTGYEKGQYFAINAFKAMFYSQVISHITLKTVFGRERPHRPLDGDAPAIAPDTRDPYDFFNSREEVILSSPEGSAFPSLHATAFAAVAQVSYREFNNYWGYALLGAVFLADIEEHNHWVSDLAAGFLLGGLIGNGVVDSSVKRRNLSYKKKRNKLKFTPEISGNYSGVRLGFEW